MTEAKLKRETKRRRPSEEKANKAVETFLEAVLGDVPDFTLVEDGDATSAPGKCGWAFWVLHADTTSYVHEDLSIEWYGTRWQKGDPLDHEGEIEERDPSTLGDDAKPAPSGDPDPVTIAPVRYLSKGSTVILSDGQTLALDDDCDGVEELTEAADCDGEDDRADADEPDDDEYVVTVRRDADDLDADGDPIQSWFWSGDPLMAVFDSATGAKAGADEHYEQKLDWWEEEPEYWMAHRPLGFNDVRDEDDERADPDGDELDGESGEACYRCGSTVDVGRYHGRWICDDCDDEED